MASVFGGSEVEVEGLSELLPGFSEALSCGFSLGLLLISGKVLLFSDGSMAAEESALWQALLAKTEIKEKRVNVNLVFFICFYFLSFSFPDVVLLMS